MKKEMYVCELFEMKWACSMPRKNPAEARMDAKNYIAGVLLAKQGIVINPEHFGFGLEPPEINAWKELVYPTVDVSDYIGETYSVMLREDDDLETWRTFHQECFESGDFRGLYNEEITFGVNGIGGLLAAAKDIDDEGIWTSKYGRMCLLGSKMPIPKNIQTIGEKEEVLAIIPVREFISHCSNCNTPFSAKQTCLLMERAILVPARCCNMMLWTSEKGVEAFLEKWE